MHKRPALKWLPLVFLFWLVGYLVAFFFSFGTFDADELLLVPPLSWSFLEGFRLWISWLPALTSGALVVAFSLFFRLDSMALQGGRNFFGLVFPGVMVWGITLTLLFSLGSELLLPLVHQRLDAYRYSSSSASEWLRQGDTLLEADKYAGAAEAYKRALAYEPDNEELKAKIETVELKIPEEEEKPVWSEKRYREEAASAVDKARDAFNQKDYFTAHYWATMAGEWDPEQRETAMDIASQSWEAIGALEPGEKEEERQSIYQRKLDGYRAMDEGDPILAYRLFLELSRSVGGSDPDILEFLERSRKALVNVSYPVDEARQAALQPGPGNILFRMPSRGPFVHAGKMVTIDGSRYLINFEMFHLNSDQETLFHLKASAAQFRGDTLLFRGVDRETGMLVEKMEFRHPRKSEETGQDDALRWEGDGWSVDGAAGIVSLDVPISLLRSFADGRKNLGVSDILSLYQGTGRDQEFGYQSFPSMIELLFRGSMPFFFLNIFIFSAGFGRMLRFRGSRIPLLGLILSPSVPFFLFWILEIVLWAMRLLIAYLLISTPFSLAMTGMIIVHGITLFGVLLFGAGQKEQDAGVL